MGFSRQEQKWFAIPFSSGPHSVRPLHHEPTVLVWPHTAWLSVTELDKAVVLGSDWLVFCDYGFSVCPLMPSHNTYCLTWVSLTSDVGSSSAQLLRCLSLAL